MVMTVPSYTQVPQVLRECSNKNALTAPVVIEVDATELVCPLPLLKAKQALRSVKTGELVRVMATDSGSLRDFVSFSQISGHLIQGFYVQDKVYYYLICKH
jgi:tRNA 2-thiouridine synthesizing protein A